MGSASGGVCGSVAGKKKAALIIDGGFDLAALGIPIKGGDKKEQDGHATADPREDLLPGGLLRIVVFGGIAHFIFFTSLF